LKQPEARRKTNRSSGSAKRVGNYGGAPESGERRQPRVALQQ
jgi:hypothetical protein